MATEIPPQGQSRKALRLQQALTDSIAVWNQAPSLRSRPTGGAGARALGRNGQIHHLPKERGELETGAHGPDFASGLLVLALVGSTI